MDTKSATQNDISISFRLSFYSTPFFAIRCAYAIQRSIPVVPLVFMAQYSYESPSPHRLNRMRDWVKGVLLLVLRL